jgi:hypothetical protein
MQRFDLENKILLIKLKILLFIDTTLLTLVSRLKLISTILVKKRPKSLPVTWITRNGLMKESLFLSKKAKNRPLFISILRKLNLLSLNCWIKTWNCQISLKSIIRNNYIIICLNNYYLFKIEFISIQLEVKETVNSCLQKEALLNQILRKKVHFLTAIVSRNDFNE